MFVKVCGITRLQDADLAIELGASALGFLFWPGSARYIAPGDAAAIVRRQPAGVTAVGVFVDEAMDRVRQLIDTVGLHVAQLHGGESPEYCRDYLALPVMKPQARRRVIKAVGLTAGVLETLDRFGDDIVILLDAHDPVRHGGTGRTVDWPAARAVAATRPAILSGGLNADNVGRALEAVRPYGIDVSSGVESAPGIKDAAKLRRFFEALHE